NADGKDDLAIGVANEDLGSVINVGGVEVIYGSSTGLSATLAHADQFWTQESPDIENHAQSEAQFGFSLTARDFNADGKDDLAIGVPFENVGSVVDAVIDAGGVEVIYGSSSGLSATLAHADQFWSQDSPDIDGSAETGDFFSHSLG
ncbi:MAG TPA: integrin alpha, partial [Nitrososphaeraceae archaeon]|nr:integrin alpha [Nitrososphaeraceae archaeon]